MGLYKDFITQCSSNEQTQLTIAAVDTAGDTKRKRGGGGHRGRGGRGGGGGRRGSGGGGGDNKATAPVPCDDRFYNLEDYRGLTPGNRVYLRLQRDARKKRKTSEGASSARMQSGQDAGVGRQLSVLLSAVDTLQVSAGVEASAQAPAPKPGNSTNPALQRIATRQGIQP